jgi:hypothetical protein
MVIETSNKSNHQIYNPLLLVTLTPYTPYPPVLGQCPHVEEGCEANVFDQPAAREKRKYAICRETILSK